MIKKLLPIILALVGTGAGVGAGLALKPEPAPEEHAAIDCVPVEGDVVYETVEEEEVPSTTEYVKLNNQFIVPIMNEERVEALVVTSLSIETVVGGSEVIYAREPKLRDVFLQAMFNHASLGGFDGTFTERDRMQTLRRSLRDAARSVIGGDVVDVLITEIARQDT